ncbi:MAG TPA: hypothetical protein VL651_12960 [Bacteroidia bacterium]|nr:hypothetical protein [Bacteroidia bacterium]
MIHRENKNELPGEKRLLPFFAPMRKNRIFVSVFFFFFSSLVSFAQQFKNGGLEGALGTSVDPPEWTSVPYDDPVCEATGSNGLASPDVCGLTGPMVGSGICGDPHSGSSFVSGRYGVWSATENYQEGIMQKVDGFTPGNTYTITFYQAVVKEDIALDRSGSWKVYIDDQLAGVTDISVSDKTYGCNCFNWDERTIQFTAPTRSITIKFLPLDDDNDGACNSSSQNGAVRMGIDDISIEAGTLLLVAAMRSPVMGTLIVTNSDSAAVQMNIYSDKPNDLPVSKIIPLGSSEIDLSDLHPGTYRIEFILRGRRNNISYSVK